MFANLILFLINLINLIIALFIGEYDVAKLRHPDVSWIPTSSALDLTLVGIILVVSLVNLAALVFVIVRRLDANRKWLWWTTGLGVLIISSLIVVLGKNFLPILWPTL